MLWVFISAILLGCLRNVEGFRCCISTVSRQSLSHAWMERGNAQPGAQRLSMAWERTCQSLKQMRLTRQCVAYMLPWWCMRYTGHCGSSEYKCIVLFFFFLNPGLFSPMCVCLFVGGLEIICSFITAWATEPKDHPSSGLSQPRLTLKVFGWLDVPLCRIVCVCVCVSLFIGLLACLSYFTTAALFKCRSPF